MRSAPDREQRSPPPLQLASGFHARTGRGALMIVSVLPDFIVEDRARLAGGAGGTGPG
jgi:hypothetical protein